MAQLAFSGSVWCRRFRLTSACSERLRIVRNGNPQVRLAKPGLATTCSDSHRKPATLTTKPRLERTASRQIPLSRILAPRRRSTESSTAITSGSPSGTNTFCSWPSRILAPCRPDHSARERKRWNRLNPLSALPSTARRAAHTVRRFRHSSAPVAKATAFSQEDRVNIATKGRSQSSIARAPPDSATLAMAWFPRGYATRAMELGAGRRCPYLRSSRQASLRIGSRGGNPSPLRRLRGRHRYDPDRDPDPLPAPAPD